MPTTAGDERWLRLFARLVMAGVASIALGFLIAPKES